MKTTLKTKITIQDVVEGFTYNELEGKGLFGLSGTLTIHRSSSIMACSWLKNGVVVCKMRLNAKTPKMVLRLSETFFRTKIFWKMRKFFDR